MSAGTFRPLLLFTLLMGYYTGFPDVKCGNFEQFTFLLRHINYGIPVNLIDMTRLRLQIIETEMVQCSSM